MKKNINSLTKFLFFLGLTSIILLESCEKHIQIDLPSGQLVTSTVFADSASAESAMVGLYQQQNAFNPFQLSALSGYVSVLPALSSDEMKLTSGGQFQEFAENNLTIGNADILSNWGTFYKCIYHANAIIENLNLSTALSETLKKRLTAEAKFMRAINFLYLAMEYGAVPLTLTTDYELNGILAKTPYEEVINQVVKDLKDAQNDMQPSYFPARKTRAGYYAATALLAKVYLVQKNYEAAEKQADLVIGQGAYQLAGITTTFAPTSAETILQFASGGPTYNTAEGALFILLGRPTYTLSEQLMDVFEANDLRAASWIYYYNQNGERFYLPLKYKIYYTRNGLECNIALRLAEQYLIRAEARAQLNKLSGAIADLDKVRDRANLELIADVNPGIGKNDLLLAIEQENFVEFFAEWGHRWFDLKRLGKADAVLKDIKGASWKSSDVLFPIPQTEISKNPILKQNEGYF